jgi:hypothetical protein
VAAHHTLLQHAPPGSVLIDTGFVSPAYDSCPDFYGAILAAGGASSAIGSLGDVTVEEARSLRLGCSLDGLLLTPKAAAAAGGGSMSSSSPDARASPGQASRSGGGGDGGGGVARPLDPAAIRRAPPYTWAADAGYDVACVETKCPTPFWSASVPWAWGLVGSDRNRPYQRMRAGHYCQVQLSMFVTGEARGVCWRATAASVAKP